MTAHEIDYQIFGEEMLCRDRARSTIVIADPGSFMMMDNKIQMETIFGDGSEKIRHLWPTLNAGKVLTGESLFMTAFINQDNEKESLCGSLSRKNSTIDLTEFQGKFICQKLFVQQSICWN
jgi:uncharacterized protein (AIM24 family)